MDTSCKIILFNLHIIGVQKAGTTALASFLHQHPAIYVADSKEAHVFDHPLYSEQSNKITFAHKRYQGKLKKYQNQPIICDATPITAFRSDFIRACYQYNPEAKFILVLRDPVERAISHYHMSQRRGQENRSMLSAFLLETFRLIGINKVNPWDFDSRFRHHSYLRRGCYTKQLRDVYSLIPKKQVLVLQQQVLKNQHKETMLKVFEFLEINHHDVTPTQVFTSEKTVAHWSDKLARLYARLYFFMRRENSKQWHKIIDL
jgi:hypothetical protein